MPVCSSCPGKLADEQSGILWAVTETAVWGGTLPRHHLPLSPLWDTCGHSSAVRRHVCKRISDAGDYALTHWGSWEQTSSSCLRGTHKNTLFTFDRDVRLFWHWWEHEWCFLMFWHSHNLCIQRNRYMSSSCAQNDTRATVSIHEFSLHLCNVTPDSR